MFNHISLKFMLITFGLPLIFMSSMIAMDSETLAKHSILEKEYQGKFCDFVKGQPEVVLANKRRIDCVEEFYAIEVDFAHKIFEGIGQSEYYAYKIHKKAGLLLIVEDKEDLGIIREFHDYLMVKGITYVIIYEHGGEFYIIKPEKIKDIPNNIDSSQGLKI